MTHDTQTGPAPIHESGPNEPVPKLSLFRRIMCRLGFHTVFADPCQRLITITKHRCACCDKLYVRSLYGDFIEDEHGNLS